MVLRVASSSKDRVFRFPEFAAAMELAALAIMVAISIATYSVIRTHALTERMVPPALSAFLLLANLLPLVALIILAGRRIARHRAQRSAVAGGGQLHVRLVAIFSLLASIPIVLTVIAASFMFQSGIEFWVSDRARSSFEASMNMVRDSQREIITRWSNEGRVMAADIASEAAQIPVGSPRFPTFLQYQTYQRSLSQAAVFRYTPEAGIEPITVVAVPDLAVLAKRADPKILSIVKRQNRAYVDLAKDMVWVVTALPGSDNLYLYVGTGENADFLNQQHVAAEDVLKDYRGIQSRARALQLQFNAALFAVALLIVGVAVWIALTVADRLVRPIDELVGAARLIADGDLTARVPEREERDEVGTLANAFNQMTSRLQAQTSALESRRALIEAVMSGVTAGVISISHDGTIRLINRSAATLLKTGEDNLVGKPLSLVSPELGALIASEDREAIVEVDATGEAKTLAVKITRAGEGPILTFDDITGQLLDQRRAAWSDVARRIAHEIKNPLTPIQLAAERLQRRYGKQIPADDGTFARLTDTIVRQVGDLRRMVDEFSSFARMPKPVFRSESLLDIARQTLFLHEVAHPTIRFMLQYDEPGPMLVCDRRQIGQALTNIVKNAVEAIEAKGEGAAGAVSMMLTQEADAATIVVRDSGIGLPAARDRIVEPYVTTRARGTGLGLAIVKKIVEEHFGTISFADNEGGGTCVTIRFDTVALAALDAGEAPASESRAPDYNQNRT
ncbi:ATP-binding protein [Sphingomonas sp. NFR15]|uniref:sensor histidine kinase NtrY-like n=1 Tax=Sphingomonas sp. NFR15 TaxID=1566282 RepID=UPI0008842A1D|nr:ATP-binding protein [Sphingomonas sp. NFR15]SDA36336.1 two-component system, NtrC family, nitrogen regulation sensor histidine kinase NtrY [Sphingomonas sp. NFR15]